MNLMILVQLIMRVNQGSESSDETSSSMLLIGGSVGLVAILIVVASLNSA